MLEVRELRIERFIFGSFQTNTYVLSMPLKEGGEEVVIIDPACSNEYERQVLLNAVKGLLPVGSNEPSAVSIIATHGHLDHLWGAPWACRQWNVPVRMHEKDIPMAQAMQRQYELFGIRAQAEPFPTAAIGNPCSLVTRAGTSLRIIETPGHTPGGVCLYFADEKVLFSGDTLFKSGYGRTDLPGGNTAELIRSLKYLLSLPSDVRVYPGHGEATTIGAEKW